MSTTGALGIMRPDGTIKAVTLYGGGSEISHTSTILNTFYKDEARVKQLINLGSLSRLGKYIAPAKGQRHNFDNPIDDIVIAYHRDRGDTHKVIYYDDADEFASDWYGMASYAFLYKDGSWYVSDGCLPFAKITKKHMEGRMI